MGNHKEVTIELIKSTLNEYVIKDRNRIICGRFTILELDIENKRCNIKFKFYREDNYNLLGITIQTILNAVFKDGKINKVNFIVNEKMLLTPFLDCGFTLEAIFTDNVFSNGNYEDELGLGITKNEYINTIRSNVVDLKGLRIQIRNFTPNDAGELLDYYIRNEEHLKEFEPSRDKSFYTYETQKKILFESYKHLMMGTSFDLGIYLDKKLIGKLKLSGIVYGVFKSGILGYSIDSEHEGNGYMSEAVNLLLKYCKEYLDIHRVEASTLVTNTKSQSVLLSAGFEKVGLNKKYLFINGKWRDHITFCKIL